MPSMISGVEPGFEPIEGYVLREQIGAGGYGEVWLADAPGGLKKAIKFVFGTIDERAGNELRALQRIRSVHHPFILSLERIEVIDNHLIVVTELADGSLHDRMRECQQRGMIGIPRDRLLEYLRDTAEALDFLCQRHDLQHLDVKPANLLLVADRVKVADFGLIKDLQTRSLSMMAGMTPTYAAPEMFDGSPGRFSDQYSLAIVYQELLTSTLPFPGRTTAQLATEHLHKAPNLEPLPFAERAVVGKALAKKPDQRYRSCREFIDHLARLPAEVEGAKEGKRGGVSMPHQRPSTVRQTPRAARQDTPNQVETQSWSEVDRQALDRPLVELPPLELRSKRATQCPPTLFLGVGGTGGATLVALRNRLTESGMDLPAIHDVAWLLADTDAELLQRMSDPSLPGHLVGEQLLSLPLRTAHEYRHRSQEEFSPLSRRWLYNIPRSGNTEGVRPLAMVAYLDHLATIRAKLRDTLLQLSASSSDWDSSQRPYRIYLVGSAHGATGSVLSIEVAFLLQQILLQLGLDATVQAVLSVGQQSEFISTELQASTAVATLREFHHYFRAQGLYPGIPGVDFHPMSSPPWSHLYLIDGGLLGRPSGWRKAIEEMSDFLRIDACTPLGEALDQVRQSPGGEQHAAFQGEPWLRTFASRRFELRSDVDPGEFGRRSILSALSEWLELFQQPAAPTHGSENTIERKPLISLVSSIDAFVTELFRDREWGVQAWIQQCTRLMLQNSDSENTSCDVSHDSSAACEDGLLDGAIDPEDWNAFCETLCVELEGTRRSASRLIDRSLEGMRQAIFTRWLQSISGWQHLSSLIEAIDQRFVAQIASMKSVEGKLRAKQHEVRMQLDALLQKKPATRQFALIEDEFEQRLRSLDAQIAIHRVALRMLLRLKEIVAAQLQAWQRRSTGLFKQFGHWSNRLAAELNWNPAEESGPGSSVEDASQGRLSLPVEMRRWIDTALMEYAHRLLEPIARRPVWSCVGRPAESAQRDEAEEQEAMQAYETWLLPKVVQPVSEFARDERETWLAESASEEPTASLPSDESTTHVHLLDRSLIARELPDKELTLLERGGGKRTLLLYPHDLFRDEEVERWKRQLEHSVTTVEMSGLSSAMLCVDGEQIELSKVMNRFWAMNKERKDLAERLHSRNDIDWLPLE